MISLGLVHWTFLILLVILVIISIRKNEVFLYYLLAILILGFVVTGSVFNSVIGLFDSILYIFREFANIILAIMCVSSLGTLLERTTILDLYIKPFTKLLKNKYIGFWVIGFISLVLTLFFYPSPAVTIVAVMFLPLAKKIDMPIIWVAVALNLFAHGFAFSGDYIMQSAPSIVSLSADISTADLISHSLPLWLTMGLTTTITAFILLCITDRTKKTISNKKINYEKESVIFYKMSNVKRIGLAIISLILLILAIVFMFVLKLSSSHANALLSGTAILIIVIICTVGIKDTKVIESTITDGMKKSVGLFAKIIPMAAFFYLGGESLFEIYGEGILGVNSQGIISDFALKLSSLFSINKASAVVMTGLVAAITGLDGSGFSGLPLVGAIAKLLTNTFPNGVAPIAFYGQMLAIYVGGGCLVLGAVIPVAMACDIKIKDLIKMNLIPIVVGAIVTGILTILLI